MKTKIDREKILGLNEVERTLKEIKSLHPPPNTFF